MYFVCKCHYRQTSDKSQNNKYNHYYIESENIYIEVVYMIKATDIQPISFEDIENMGLTKKVMIYDELRKYKTIDQVLRKPLDYVVLFVKVDSHSYGHYECVVRVNDEIFFYDGYGIRVDKSLLFTKKGVRKIIGQTYPYLSIILNNSIDKGFKVYFNTFQYQADDTQTCGYMCVSFIKYMLTAKDKSFDGYHSYIMSMKKKLKINDLDVLIYYLAQNETPPVQ